MRSLFFNTTVIENNDIVSNDIAIQLNSSCEDNYIISNNYVDNLTDAMIMNIHYVNHYSENGRGNFWSRYDGYDLNFDNIGDIAHKPQDTFGYLESKYPSIRFYMYSPAAHLLDFAEKQFPIIKVESIEDAYPIYKRTENDAVPWERAISSEPKLAYTSALFWLLAIILPGLFGWRMKR